MDDNLAFLFTDMARSMRREFDARARHIGVTRPQWRMLTALVRREGSNQGQLADHLEVEPITLARMVDRLQEAGLVERRPDPADRRAWLLYLTPKARPIVERLQALGETMFTEAVDGISATEIEQVRRTVQTMRANMARHYSLCRQKDAANG